MMSTITQTRTRTDIRRVFECFQADLQMLAIRTQAILLGNVGDYAHDIFIMAQEKCLKKVHIQLLDGDGNLIRSHEYCVEENISWDSHRPGANRWPCLPSGELLVIATRSDIAKFEALKQSNSFNLTWGPSSVSTDYSHMNKDSGKMYASNGYGLRRNSFTI